MQKHAITKCKKSFSKTGELILKGEQRFRSSHSSSLPVSYIDETFLVDDVDVLKMRSKWEWISAHMFKVWRNQLSFCVFWWTSGLDWACLPLVVWIPAIRSLFLLQRKAWTLFWRCSAFLCSVPKRSPPDAVWPLARCTRESAVATVWVMRWLR